MARTILVTDLISLRVWCTQGTPDQQATVTTFDYYIDPGTFVSGMTDLQLCTSLDGAAAPVFKALICTTAFYRGVQLTYLNVTPLPATQFFNGNNGAGTFGANSMPTQVRGITKRQTAFAGPRYRGRIYWPFPAVGAATSSGGMTGAYQTAITNVLSALCPTTGLTVISGGGTAKVLPILWNRHLRLATNITAYGSDIGFATQKKSGYYGKVNTSPV